MSDDELARLKAEHDELVEREREAADVAERIAALEEAASVVRGPVRWGEVVTEPPGLGAPGRQRDEPGKRRRGRPPGSGRAIPTAEYLLGEYRRVRGEMGRPPTQKELAASMTDARTGTKDVPFDTLKRALKDFEVRWPPE